MMQIARNLTGSLPRVDMVWTVSGPYIGGILSLGADPFHHGHAHSTFHRRTGQVRS